MKSIDEVTRDLTMELGIRPYLVSQAVRELNRAGRLKWQHAPGKGRKLGKRLYGAEAVAEMRQWLEAWKRDHAAKMQLPDATLRFWRTVDDVATAAEQLRAIAWTAACLAERLAGFKISIEADPFPQATFLNALGPGLVVIQPIPVLLMPLRGGSWTATVTDAGLATHGPTPMAALNALRAMVRSAYRRLKAAPGDNPALWAVLDQLVRPKEAAARSRQ